MKRIYIEITVLVILAVTAGALPALAGEKIGSLVFNAMRKIQDTHETFMTEVSQIRSERNSAIEDREMVRKKFEQTAEHSLDRKEYHAQYSYTQARVFKALYNEAKLTRTIAGKQLEVLHRLKDSIEETGVGVDGKDAVSMVEASKPFLANGRTLLKSLAKYRAKINDPAINAKLNAAYDTAQMLSKYVEHTDYSLVNRYASQQVLKKKVSELIEQLNALYVQTDIIMAMVQNKSTRLKMITELAAADASITVLRDGETTISQLAEEIINPMFNELQASDRTLDTLFAGVFEEEKEPVSRENNQQWTRPNF